jgi:hypothetical protein
MRYSVLALCCLFLSSIFFIYKIKVE